MRNPYFSGAQNRKNSKTVHGDTRFLQLRYGKGASRNLITTDSCKVKAGEWPIKSLPLVSSSPEVTSLKSGTTYSGLHSEEEGSFCTSSITALACGARSSVD